METIKVIANGSWVGTIVKYDRGYKYQSRVSGIGDSRKFHDRAHDAVPKRIGKWIFG